ncbi:porin [Pigmentiphaga soli]|uniref:Porin n=2 Tax=Pigmentiphaga soli TaxID=1007095 RepID=A0ABP8HAQ1_9BURK
MAHAQSSVTVYGKLYPQINNYDISSATPVGSANSLSVSNGAPSRHGTAMESSNSRLGFRGVESLGNDMKAFFKLEMQLGVDDGSVSSTNFWNRASLVGLSGNFGSFSFGRMDTVYKTLGDQLDMLGIGSGNFPGVTTILSYQGFGANTTSNFHGRANNSVLYESPKFYGFQLLGQYAFGEVPNDSSSGSQISAGLKYQSGSLYVALAHEIHDDLYGGSRNMPTAAQRSLTGKQSRDQATRFTARYGFTKSTTAEFDIASLQWKESGGPIGDFEKYKRISWSLIGQHKIGPWTLQASYGEATAGSCELMGGVGCSTAGLGAHVYNIGASYALSKRTMVFVIASQLNNNSLATFSNTSAAGKADPGADIRQIAIGMSHSF